MFPFRAVWESMGDTDKPAGIRLGSKCAARYRDPLRGRMRAKSVSRTPIRTILCDSKRYTRESASEDLTQEAGWHRQSPPVLAGS
jgi:hypothetical protein